MIFLDANAFYWYLGREKIFSQPSTPKHDVRKCYEPQIVKASVRTVNQPDGSKQRIVDQEIKAYILSELAMKIMVKYDLNKKPSKRRPPQSGSSSDFDLTG